MTNSYRSHYFHLIWSTKNRKKIISPDIRQRLYNYIGGITQSYKITLLCIGGMEDHIHLLISVGNIEKYSDIIKNIKTGSSKWLRENFPEQGKFSWQDGYASFTVSHSSVKKVQNYIVNQEKHHLSNTFENEYALLLNRHNIDYDNAYYLG